MNLDKQLTKAAIKRLYNGNLPSGADAAPIVGVTTPGSFDYDNDILEIVLAMAELQYIPSTVLGDRGMMKELMSLPEFKGFDGATVKADYMLDSIPFPTDYNLMVTKSMPKKTPSGGQLLFVDTANAMKHYTSKVLTLESLRQPRQLLDEYYVSMTTQFVKQQVDASCILDSTVNITTNPFPAEFDNDASYNEEF